MRAGAGSGGVRVVTTVDFASALDDYSALLDRIEDAMEREDWDAFDAAPGELPPIEGGLAPELEARATAVIARAADVRERLQRAAAEVAGSLVDDSQRVEAHRRYISS